MTAHRWTPARPVASCEATLSNQFKCRTDQFILRTRRDLSRRNLLGVRFALLALLLVPSEEPCPYPEEQNESQEGVKAMVVTVCDPASVAHGVAHHGHVCRTTEPCHADQQAQAEDGKQKLQHGCSYTPSPIWAKLFSPQIPQGRRASFPLTRPTAMWVPPHSRHPWCLQVRCILSCTMGSVKRCSDASS